MAEELTSVSDEQAADLVANTSPREFAELVPLEERMFWYWSIAGRYQTDPLAVSDAEVEKLAYALTDDDQFIDLMVVMTPRQEGSRSGLDLLRGVSDPADDVPAEYRDFMWHHMDLEALGQAAIDSGDSRLDDPALHIRISDGEIRDVQTRGGYSQRFWMGRPVIAAPLGGKVTGVVNWMLRNKPGAEAIVQVGTMGTSGTLGTVVASGSRNILGQLAAKVAGLAGRLGGHVPGWVRPTAQYTTAAIAGAGSGYEVYMQQQINSMTPQEADAALGRIEELAAEGAAAEMPGVPIGTQAMQSAGIPPFAWTAPDPASVASTSFSSTGFNVIEGADDPEAVRGALDQIATQGYGPPPEEQTQNYMDDPWLGYEYPLGEKAQVRRTTDVGEVRYGVNLTRELMTSPIYSLSSTRSILDNMTPDQLEDFQTKAIDARLIDPDATIGGVPFVAGQRGDAHTERAMEAVLREANVSPYTDTRDPQTAWHGTLSRMVADAEKLPEETIARTPFVKAAYLRPDPAEITQAVKGAIRDKLGREPNSWEMQLFADSLKRDHRASYDALEEQRYRTYQAQGRATERAEQYPEANVSVMAEGVQGVDIEARFAERFEKTFADELARGDRTEFVSRATGNLMTGLNRATGMMG